MAQQGKAVRPLMDFPLLALAPVQGTSEPGAERAGVFLTERGFFHSARAELESGMRLGMLVIDSAGECWRVLRVTDLSPPTTGWRRLFARPATSAHRVDYDLAQEAPLPLELVKQRVRAAIDPRARPSPDGSPPSNVTVLTDEARQVTACVDKVLKANSVLELIARLHFSMHERGLL